VCNAGACASECSAGLTECGGACVDLDHDPGHCGGCDTSCDPATGATGICEAGACRRICGPLLGDCNGDLQAAGGDGCETSLATDPMNCGACALACAMPNAVPGCVDGACTIATCIAGFADCDSDASNGCELDVREDESNC